MGRAVLHLYILLEDNPVSTCGLAHTYTRGMGSQSASRISQLQPQVDINLLLVDVPTVFLFPFHIHKEAVNKLCLK